MTITPDWKTILFTDPENFDNWDVYRSVYMVDAISDQLESIIPPPPPPYYGVPDPNLYFNPVQIAITPDGEYAMASTGLQFCCWVGLLSLRDRKYVEFFQTDTLWNEPTAVACRAKL
ncbi:MAG: hypothetical protein AAB305_05670 [Candidatus Zixiibacteriota bacterium]